MLFISLKIKNLDASVFRVVNLVRIEVIYKFFNTKP